ncbi:MAG: ABC transporter ATP-binding protein [Desulfobacteraceae bacterium]|jgi:lipoprotein-releasing system ATP-binding protein|nr:ABC transporter ATP-binding protein [Desulfobacteraceae bacterium]
MADTEAPDTGGSAKSGPRPNGSALITARGISKQFLHNGIRIEVLRGVDFDLAAGETVAVVGESGIGKSTLLHILGTLDRPDSGQLHFRGEDVFEYGNDRLARFRNESIGFVFQFHHLLSEFTAVENTMMPGLINGLDKHTARQAAERVLVRVGLEKRLGHRVSKLSGGEQQRVALARALVAKPALLLADEPTGNLDRRNSEQVHELLLTLNEELKMALVVVTHNLTLASYMTRRVTIVNGKLEETK